VGQVKFVEVVERDPYRGIKAETDRGANRIEPLATFGEVRLAIANRSSDGVKLHADRSESH